jgi:hypothetical protein
MSIHDKIAKLPEHHEPRLIPELVHFGGSAEARYWEREAHCYRAELALAREWIADSSCREGCCWDAVPDSPCTCGRGALLAAITPPGEKT